MHRAAPTGKSGGLNPRGGKECRLFNLWQKETPMKRLNRRGSIGLALTGATMLGLCLLQPATPVVAQQPAVDPGLELVPISATATGKAEGYLIPMVPPVAVARVVGKGEVTLLGRKLAATAVSDGRGRVSLDGQPISTTDAVSVLTAANGDEVIIKYDTLFRAPLSPTRLPYGGTFVVVGGRGRFEGAVGSGSFTGEVNPLTGDATIQANGLISRPKSRPGFGAK
jgi:hypothetical protein